MSTEMIYSKRFYQAYPKKNAFAGDVLSNEIIRQTKKYIKGDVLDCGAGSGNMMDCLEVLPSTRTIRGIDLAPTRSDIIEAGLDNIPFPDESFDSVMFNAVIEHLNDKLLYDALKEIHRVLKYNGHVIITTAYKEDLNGSMVECPKCKERFHRWGHVRSYDNDVMGRQISPLFKVVKMYHTSLGFLNAHPKLRCLLPVINAMGFLKGDEYLICIAQKTKESKQ